jgi:vanillate O-demethylase ferredoxin subunit
VNIAVRSFILSVHRWTGLTVGLVLVFIASIGVSMAFRAQLEPIVDSDLRDKHGCTAPLPLDALASRARAAYPGKPVALVQTSDGGTAPTIVRFSDLHDIYLDSCTGNVLGQRNRWGGFFGTVEWLHRLRFIGDTDVSESIGGTVALFAALVMVAGGLVAWWPRTWKAFRNGLKFRLQLKGRAFDMSLHRTAGFYVAAVLLLSSLTALTLTFDWARGAIFAATGTAPMPRKPAAEASKAPLAPLETLMARTLQAVPGARDVQINLPKKPRDAVEVQVIERDAPHKEARTYVYLAPATGAVIRVDSYAASSLGNKVYRFVGALHMGAIGGPAVQALLFTGILGVPLLGFTGMRSWWRGRRSLNAR